MCLEVCTTTSPLLAVRESDTKGHFCLCQTQDVSEAFMKQLHLCSLWVGSTPYILLEERKSRSDKREALSWASLGANLTKCSTKPRLFTASQAVGLCSSQIFFMEEKRLLFIISFNLIERVHGIYFLYSKINSTCKASSPSEGNKM